MDKTGYTSTDGTVQAANTSSKQTGVGTEDRAAAADERRGNQGTGLKRRSYSGRAILPVDRQRSEAG